MDSEATPGTEASRSVGEDDDDAESESADPPSAPAWQ
jgi:hypothetical protein